MEDQTHFKIMLLLFMNLSQAVETGRGKKPIILLITISITLGIAS